MNKRRWYGLVALSLGVAAIIVDATIVNVAVPTIINDLKATATQIQWIQEAYTLVFASTLLLFGRLADRSGRKKIFVLGVFIFVISSIFAAIAPTPELLIATRIIQGLGGAMMLPTSVSILNSTFFGKERGIAFAIWGSTIGGAAALGPLIGGWLTTEISWRWAFGINLPIGVLVLIGTYLFVNESIGEGESGTDYLGALLSVLTMGSLVFALIEGRNYGWSSTLIIGSFISFLFFGAVFAWIQVKRNRTGKPVLFDLSLLKISTFRNGNFAAAIVALGEFGLLFSFPIWIQNVLQRSAFQTGLILLPLAIGSFFASGAGIQLVNRYGALRVVQIGLALEVVGVGLAALLIKPTLGVVRICVILFVYGMGVGLATAQLTSVVLADVPKERSGQASGITSTMRQLGSALGIAILGTALFSTFSSGLKTLNNPGLQDLLVKTAGAPIAKLPPESKSIAEQALSDAAKSSAIVATIFLIIGLIATSRMANSRTDLSGSDHR